MRLKFIIGIVVITVVTCVAFSLRTSTIASQSYEPGSVKVVLTQLRANGGIPIEIANPVISSSASNRLDDVTYTLRNNSSKRVDAVAVSKKVTYEEAGKVYADSIYATLDYRMNADLDLKNRFEPGTESHMEASGPLNLPEGAVIKEIELRVDYVSFVDNTAYGAGGEGEHKINSMREGALKYKNWLGQKYSRAGNSLTAVLPLIQQQHTFDGLQLDLDQTLGADRYRLHLLEMFKTRGAADVEKYFKQN